MNGSEKNYSEQIRHRYINTMSKQKIHSTTQDFTEIIDIIEDIVLFKGRNACSVMEISSVNFFLLSQDEQNARIYGYMSLLNSITFPLQIVILSKKIDLTNYIKILDQKIENSKNPRIADHLQMYKTFIQELIKGGQLLDKKNYIVIPFSSLELGAVSVAKNNKVDFIGQIRNALISKRTTVMTQVERVGLTARVLGQEELAKLFFELFNKESINLDFNSSDVKNIIL